MTCPTCNLLRFRWYATATPIPDAHKLHEKKWGIIVKVRDGDRRTHEYREALKAYREHLKGHE